MNQKTNHGGPRKPGPGKRLGRPPLPPDEHRKKFAVYMPAAKWEAVVSAFAAQGVTAETAGKAVAAGLEQLASGELVLRRHHPAVTPAE